MSTRDKQITASKSIPKPPHIYGIQVLKSQTTRSYRKNPASLMQNDSNRMQTLYAKNKKVEGQLTMKVFESKMRKGPSIRRTINPNNASQESDLDYSKFSPTSSNEVIPSNTVSADTIEPDDTDKDGNFVLSGSRSQSSISLSELAALAAEPVMPVFTPPPRHAGSSSKFTKRVQNAWAQAKHALRLESNSARSSRDSDCASSTGRDPVRQTEQKGDGASGLTGNGPTLKHLPNSQSEDEVNLRQTKRSTRVILNQHTNNLMGTLKSTTLQLAQRDMEMQRLTTVNSQLGEQYCRMRTQYAELAREQARLRQRYDMLLIKGMDRDQLHTSNIQLGKEANDLRLRLAQTEQQAQQYARELSRVTTEAKDVAQTANTSDTQVASLLLELERRETRIQSLTCRQFMNAAREMQGRAILHELMDLKGNIRVVIRNILLHRDISHNFRCNPGKVVDDTIFNYLGDDTIVTRCTPSTNAQGSPTQQSCKASRVFQPAATQKMVFDEISDLVSACVDGYSVAITAYGQTGSGKTYTMLGIPTKPGIIPRVARHLMAQCQQRDPLWNYRISISVIQIHKETITDLLAESASQPNAKEPDRITLHDNGRQILLRGALEIEVNTEQEILETIRKARSRRQQLATELKISMSHLHFIAILRVRGLCKLNKFGEEIDDLAFSNNSMQLSRHPPTPASHIRRIHSQAMTSNSRRNNKNDSREPCVMVTHGLLVLSDLAGFSDWEPCSARIGYKSPITRLASTGSSGSGGNAAFQRDRIDPNQEGFIDVAMERMHRNNQANLPPSRPMFVQPHRREQLSNEADVNSMEARHIGRSLITLHRVYEALSDAAVGRMGVHIPFRDSKLTHLLKPTLTGEAKCVLLITLHSDEAHLKASLRSLRLAEKATTISLGRAQRNSSNQGGIRITGISANRSSNISRQTSML